MSLRRASHVPWMRASGASNRGRKFDPGWSTVRFPGQLEGASTFFVSKLPTSHTSGVGNGRGRPRLRAAAGFRFAL